MVAWFTAAQAAQKFWRISCHQPGMFTAAQAAQKYPGGGWDVLWGVHCRTGSSEMMNQIADQVGGVHCRTGSSES